MLSLHLGGANILIPNARDIPALVKELMEHPEHLSLEWGERRGMSVYFSDIAGFTSFSETVTPEELVTNLNRYLGAAADAVLAEHGDVECRDAACQVFRPEPVIWPARLVRHSAKSLCSGGRHKPCGLCAASQVQDTKRLADWCRQEPWYESCQLPVRSFN